MKNSFETTENNLESGAYMGSMQRVLAKHVGEPVVADFLLGTNNLMTKSGILHDVGEKYLVIYNNLNDSYVVGDFFNLKFVTFSQKLANITQTTQMRY